jgi:NAD+ diphosphatase
LSGSGSVLVLTLIPACEHLSDVMLARFVPAVSAPPTDHARQFVIREHSLLIQRVDERPAIPVGAVDESWLFLGHDGDVPCFARSVARDEASPEGGEAVPLRELFGALPDEDFAIATRALGLTTWDEHHRFCGRCGAETTRSTTERARNCTRCALAHYPRLSPAVIVLVERDGRALLARNARFPRAFHSCLAGFVEVGETLEETVAREVEEEAGIQVTDVRYAGSQPWPFTASLMIGFTARWAGGEIVADATEISDADWFAPDAMPSLPSAISISRALIDAFVARHS